MLEESMSGPVTNPVFLAFEASGDQASVAVLAADGRQAMFHHAARHGHAAAITSLAEAALQACGMDAGAVTHVAAGCGPGSFTGIRVALAAAKGYQLACKAMPVGLSCLAAMAVHAQHDHPENKAIWLATADTRRGSFFCQPFAADGTALGEIMDIDPDLPDNSAQSINAMIADGWEGARVIGPGAAILAAASAGRLLADDGHQPLEAMQIAQLASTLVASHKPLPPLVPLYVAPAFLGPPRS